MQCLAGYNPRGWIGELACQFAYKLTEYWTAGLTPDVHAGQG